MGHIRGGDTDHEARRGQDSVVRTEHGCTEPADSVGVMPFGVTRKALHGALIADPDLVDRTYRTGENGGEALLAVVAGIGGMPRASKF
jgi:hypothetical protein